VLDDLQRSGVPGLSESRQALAGYRTQMAMVDPDALSEHQALAYWLNVYNAGAIDLAAEAFQRADDSVLRVPGGFEQPWIEVGGETLTLTEIEHGKLRRFIEPRIHGALVCGSASCPTLRYETYRGNDLNAQLDDQMQHFLAGGGAVADRDRNTLALSRVFLWYGGDFVRPQRMPTWRPPRKARLVAHLSPWLEAEQVEWVQRSAPNITFQSYDWSLACEVR
jgi:hypothetical protein